MIFISSAILITYALLRIASAVETHAYAVALQNERNPGELELVVDNTRGK